MSDTRESKTGETRGGASRPNLVLMDDSKFRLCLVLRFINFYNGTLKPNFEPFMDESERRKTKVHEVQQKNEK